MRGDELAGTMYAVVERSGAGACYLPVSPEVATQLAVGDKVRVSSPTESWVKASDRIIARYAADHGGTYAPAAHLRELVIRGDRNASEQPSPADLVKANVRRLDRLGLRPVPDDTSRMNLHVPPRIGTWSCTKSARATCARWSCSCARAGSSRLGRFTTSNHLTATLFRTAIAEELIEATPCVLQRGVLPNKVDKDPT